MKVLISHLLPFALAHGGYQTQIEATKRALEDVGLEVEWQRWWDDQQRGEMVHAFSPADPGYLLLARDAGVPVVLTTLLTGECNHPPARLRLKRWKIWLLSKIPGLRGINHQLPWQSYHLCTTNVVGLAVEKRVLETVYGVPSEKVSVVPLGMSDAYLRAAPSPRTGDHLICTGTITGRKRSLETARLARRAEVPILFVGKPYHQADPYWQEFKSLIDEKWVRYQPHVADEAQMIELYRAARGFTLASAIENWCLSAHEAAACGLPCLLRRQPWSLERFGAEARYLTDDPSKDATILRKFYEDAPTMPPPRIKQWSWQEVGEQLAEVYRRTLASPR